VDHARRVLERERERANGQLKERIEEALERSAS